MTTTEIKVGRLLAHPGREPPKHNVTLAIADGRIKGIEPSEPTAESARLLAMPVLINAHDHGYGLQPMSFGAVDDALECWIAGLRGRPKTDPYLEAKVAFGRMALGGIGATMHCHNSLNADDLLNEAAAVARAAGEVGIRVGFSCPILDRNPWIYGGPDYLEPHLSKRDWQTLREMIPSYAPAKEQIARADAIAAAHTSPSFTVQYGPIGPQWCEDKTLELIAEASAQSGRRIHMHLLESERQRAWLDHAYPQGILRHLDQIGLLSPRLAVAHGVWLTDDECALLAERGVTVVVNTAANLRLRSGVAPVDRFRRHGVKFTFGLDGTSFDDNQDAFRDLRLASLLHQGSGLKPEIGTEELFKAAYDHGYSVITGEPGYGGLEKGSPADLVLIDYAALSEDLIVDDVDELTVLMTRMSSDYLVEAYVAGRLTVQQGKVTGFDYQAARQDLIASAKQAKAQLKAGRPLIQRQTEAIRTYYFSNARSD